jgi:hypothetical protein
MERNSNSSNAPRKGNEGSGSAENKGLDRSQQVNRNTSLDKDQRKKIANEAGIGRKRIADIEELGQKNGRDDYAGGDNDGMENESTGGKTAQ